MSSVHIFGIDVPEWEHMTGHEWEQVELLLADLPQSDIRANLQTLKIFVESRTDHTFDVDEYLQQPINGNELHEANERLLRPFASARREREEKRLATQAHLLTTPQLEARKKVLESALEAVNDALATGGGDSRRSSSTTTQDGDSKAGKRGRSKKRSN